MPDSKREAIAALPPRPGSQLRKIGFIVLLTGLAIGGLIYLFGPVEGTSEKNTLQTEYYKNQELETQRLWGNEGSLVLEITRSLKQASTYSIIVIALSALVSFACFYLASHPHDGNRAHQGKLRAKPSPTNNETAVAEAAKKDRGAWGRGDDLPSLRIWAGRSTSPAKAGKSNCEPAALWIASGHELADDGRVCDGIARCVDHRVRRWR
jgi:hypothetical protein